MGIQENELNLFSEQIRKIDYKAKQIVVPLISARIEAINNKDPKILEGLAKMHFFYNNMEKASFFYEKLLEINPNFKNIWSSFRRHGNYGNF